METINWTQVEPSDGIKTFRLEGWNYFFNLIEVEVLNRAGLPGRSYIWRGQRRSDWPLSSTIDRLFGRLGFLAAGQDALEKRSKKQLETFRYAARGRRGPSPTKLSENELWALGQHFGLATPLLDWTRSPFAAAYFAFEELASDPTPFRTVYALNERVVLSAGEQIDNGPSIEQGRPPLVEIVDPLYDENQRLVNQGGCFTRAPIGTPIEQWVATVFENSTEPVLIKIEIPDDGRIDCLRTLNLMNINHLSLFPDLIGASRFTNLRFELEGEHE